MKLIIITPSFDIPNETNIIINMFESGLLTLHLRKPKYTTQQMCEYIKRIPAQFHNRIVIHSHHKLALKFNLKGIHYTSSHLKKKTSYFWVRFRLRLKLGQLIKSCSYQRLQQVYKIDTENYEYIFLSTIFNSLTGELYSGYTKESLIAANTNSSKKFVARGGTKPDTIKLANELHFYGIAFNSYIWDSGNPFDNFISVLNRFRDLNLNVK